MAETPVPFIAQKLYSLLAEEVTLLQGVRDQVQWLERQLRWLQAFLRDADSKRQRGHEVGYWVRHVREVAFDDEDMVDTYILNMHQMHSFMKRYACIFRRVTLRHNIGMQIEGMKTKLQELREHRGIYGINVGGTNEEMFVETQKAVKERRELAIRWSGKVVVGFKDDMKSITEVLLDKENKRPCVISLVGMGGVGKSTIAKRIFDESRDKEEFGDRCALVGVSQSYTQSKLLKDIATEFPNFVMELEKKNLDDEPEIRKKLPEFLERGRYLIVLDDVWDNEVWTLLEPFLPDKQNGGRVIITTRSMEVARFTDPSTPPHSLKTLDEGESWDLFTKTVFPGEEVERACNGELQDLGKKIVKNCGGLPLALVVMGGLLSMKERSVRAWQNVIDGFDWQGSLEGEVPLKILALSYEALPHHLKSCFLYFSCFPEDFEIDAKKLVCLWVAEGLVPDEEKQQLRRKSITMEDIAEGWLEDLIQRCLVQPVKLSRSGRVRTCRIHDLLLDLAINEAKEVNFFYTCQNTQPLSTPTTARRLALCPGVGSEFHTMDLCAPKLRSFLYVRSWPPFLYFILGECGLDDSLSLQFIESSKLLRVLDLGGAGCRKLPRAIGDLIHLRYLGLRNNDLRRIPCTVRKLQNLQTFDVRGNVHLEKLPTSVWGIGTTFRHVFMDPRTRSQIAAGKEDLVNLQTLQTVKAGSWMHGRLATMTNVRVLALWGILPTHHPALAKSLDSLLRLCSLELSGVLPRKALALPNHRHLEELTLRGRLVDSENSDGPPPNYSSQELPPNLYKLELTNCGLQQDPLTLLHKLSHLRELEICSDADVEEKGVWVCPEGGFPQLESLKLTTLRHAMQLRVEFGAMPHLNSVSIDSCPRLELSMLRGFLIVIRKSIE